MSQKSGSPFILLAGKSSKRRSGSPLDLATWRPSGNLEREAKLNWNEPTRMSKR
jgi:hypothetical protein